MLGCIYATGGFPNREEYLSIFLCSLLFHRLVQHIFLVEKEKIELIFLKKEVFDFLWKDWEHRISLSRGNTKPTVIIADNLREKDLYLFGWI